MVKRSRGEMSRGMLVVCKIQPVMTRERVRGAGRMWREMESIAVECGAAGTEARQMLGEY